MKALLILFSILSVCFADSFNARILREIDSMPSGGGYSIKEDAFNGLAEAVSMDDGKLIVSPYKAKTSFCSSATYLVFLKAVTTLQNEGRINLSERVLSTLQFKDEEDGFGFWGRWNSNGPGVAKLATDLNLGVNFQSYDIAEAGDFMKIFWTDEIGRKEHGHLVIYLGRRTDADGTEYIKFWSSNKPNGYGAKEVSRDKIKWAIFTRIPRVANLKNLPKLSKSDKFLVDMLKKRFTKNEVIEICKIR